jgi:hypothetical protein
MFWHRDWFNRATHGRHAAARRRRVSPRVVEQLESRALLSSISGAGGGAVPINYNSYENVFVSDFGDGSVRYSYTTDGSTFTPVDLGVPSVPVETGPAVINYQVPGGALHENVWAIGAANNGETITDVTLFVDVYNGNNWTGWMAAQSLPANAKLSVITPVVNNYQAGNILDEDVLVSATNGSLYQDHWNGTQWQWNDLGTLGPSISYSSVPTVVNYTGSGGTTRENIFATGTDGNLYVGNGANWSGWTNAGNPGVSVTNAPAAINYTLTGGTVTQNVFVSGANGELYDYHWNGTKWAWTAMGFPAQGVTIDYSETNSNAPLTVINNQSGSTVHEHVFVSGSDGNLYNDFWNGTSWAWGTAGDGSPPGTGAAMNGPIGVVNFQVGDTLEMDVFVVGYYAAPGSFATGTLYLDYWNGSDWTWVNTGVTGW